MNAPLPKRPHETPDVPGPSHVSIVIPVRNAMPYLAEALQSVLRQQIIPLETLVVDGGSSDGSPAYAAGIPQVRLTPQTGYGLADARNQGLAHAQGEFIAFLDADDRWADGWLAAATAYLHEDTDCQAVLGQMVRFLQPGVPLPQAYAGGWLDQPTTGFTPGALVARREVFAQVGPFDALLTVGCDSDWFARASDAGIYIVHLPRVALFKRIHTANLSAQVTAYRKELLTVARRSLQRRGVIPPASGL